jgi:hypothetical protein
MNMHRVDREHFLHHTSICLKGSGDKIFPCEIDIVELTYLFFTCPPYRYIGSHPHLRPTSEEIRKRRHCPSRRKILNSLLEIPTFLLGIVHFIQFFSVLCLAISFSWAVFKSVHITIMTLHRRLGYLFCDLVPACKVESRNNKSLVTIC